jgi:hypothetical protein
MKKTKSLERREHKRYFVKNRIFAVVRSKDHQLNHIADMSKGEIAFAVIRSNPPKMGEIKEISQSGLTFHYVHNESDVSEFKEMDILFADEDFHLGRIPFKAIDDTAIGTDSPLDTLAMKQLTVKFGGLSIQQQHQIKHMIKNFTTGEVPKKLRQTSVG